MRGDLVANSGPTVAFVMEYVPRYRKPFYHRLRAELADRGVELMLYYGDPAGSKKLRNDSRPVDWGQYQRNRFLTVLDKELTIQTFPRGARNADLVIVQQEAGQLLNYLLVLRALFGRPFAVWGHGENPNPETRSRPMEFLKAMITRRAHWVFAYTERSERVFRDLGFDRCRISVVNNSQCVVTSIDPSEVSEAVRQLCDDLSERTPNVGWIVSSFDGGKRLAQLFDVLDAIRQRVPDFEFVFVGSGSDEPLIETFCGGRPWAHHLGPRAGADKAALGAVASITIMTGIVGLHVIDTFAFGAPLLTSMEPIHSHELDYVSDNVNGRILAEGASPESFATEASKLFNDPARLSMLSEAARASFDRYHLDQMVGAFADGICEAVGVAGAGPGIPSEE